MLRDAGWFLVPDEQGMRALFVKWHQYDLYGPYGVVQSFIQVNFVCMRVCVYIFF